MRRRSTALALAATLAWGAGAAMSAQAPASCPSCVEARFWEVSPTHWETTTTESLTPERPKLDALRPFDVGVAFSGGGTRSASATIGQLRALNRNGWLPRVRYVTAVSGGSWAAVPFTFHKGDLATLLGADGPLNPETIEKVPAGLLAERVVASRLGHVGLQEVPSFLPDSFQGMDLVQARKVLQMARAGIRKIRRREVTEPDRRNKTYAHLLGQIFVQPLVPDGIRRPYAWDMDSALEMSQISGRPFGEFVVPPADRPFLIVGGTLVKQAGAEYPRLIPVEYTPLYTGVRQQFGVIGGTYLWPWAYDRLYVAKRTDTHVFVGPGPDGRPFTLADVVASSGAAPQLALMLGDDRVPARFRDALTQASGAFPAFSNLAVRLGEPNPATAELAHGDGGFTDNLGIMPLLVRQVHNIIVFVNASSEFVRNEQLQSYFMRLNIRDGGGDKTMNPVFDPAKYKEVLEGFEKATAAGGGAIHCGRGWEVRKNEIYNLRGYSGLNICFVYNYAGASWKRDLPETIKPWITPPDPKRLGRQAKDLRHFPYYATFGENRTSVIRLKPLQVNMLADLAAWSISHTAAVDAILSAFDTGVLPRPATTR